MVTAEVSKSNGDRPHTVLWRKVEDRLVDEDRRFIGTRFVLVSSDDAGYRLRPLPSTAWAAERISLAEFPAVLKNLAREEAMAMGRSTIGGTRIGTPFAGLLEYPHWPRVELVFDPAEEDSVVDFAPGPAAIPITKMPTPSAAPSVPEPTPSRAERSDQFRRIGREIGELVAEKDAAYGSSFDDAGEALRLLYPDGIRPEQYTDALGVVRVFDKLKRIATDRDALGESPWRDIAGYGILGAARVERGRK